MPGCSPLPLRSRWRYDPQVMVEERYAWPVRLPVALRLDHLFHTLPREPARLVAAQPEDVLPPVDPALLEVGPITDVRVDLTSRAASVVPSVSRTMSVRTCRPISCELPYTSFANWHATTTYAASVSTATARRPSCRTGLAPAASLPHLVWRRLTRPMSSTCWARCILFRSALIPRITICCGVSDDTSMYAIARLGLDPFDHFQPHGQYEGRPLRPVTEG
jgi:hypothetical protein